MFPHCIFYPLNFCIYVAFPLFLFGCCRHMNGYLAGLPPDIVSCNFPSILQEPNVIFGPKSPNPRNERPVVVFNLPHNHRQTSYWPKKKLNLSTRSQHLLLHLAFPASLAVTNGRTLFSRLICQLTRENRVKKTLVNTGPRWSFSQVGATRRRRYVTMAIPRVCGSEAGWDV